MKDAFELLFYNSYFKIHDCISVEAFPDLVELFDVEIVQLVVFTFQLFHVKTVEAGVFQEIFAEGDMLLGDDGGEEVMDINRFLLDGENDLVEEFVRGLALDKLLVAELFRDFPFK